MFTSITLIAVFVFFYIFLPALISRIFLSFRLPIKTINTDLSQQLIEFYLPNILFMSMVIRLFEVEVDWEFVADLLSQKGVISAPTLLKHLSPVANSSAVNFKLLFIISLFAAIWGLALSFVIEKAISDQSKKHFTDGVSGSFLDELFLSLFRFRFPNLLHPWYLVFFSEKKKSTKFKLVIHLDIWTKGGQLFAGQLKDYLLKSDGDLQCISLDTAHKYIVPIEKKNNNAFYDLAKDGDKVPIKGDEVLILSHDISNVNIRRPKLTSKDDAPVNSINISISLKNSGGGLPQEIRDLLIEAMKSSEKN